MSETATSTAADAQLVDRDTPSFSDPTAITNPLLPVGELSQVVYVGAAGGWSTRVEVTLLPRTRSIVWEGRHVSTLATQAISYTDHGVSEVRLSFFAQADDGSVWSFGSEVMELEGGVVESNAGSWLAGRDGPPAMAMPADPQVGDVFRPRNIADVAYEEATVLSTSEQVEGADGVVDGVMVAERRLADGSIGQALYAPGYGEYRIELSADVTLAAVALPANGRSTPVPAALAAFRSVAITLADPAKDDGKSGDVLASIAQLGASLAALEETAPPPVFHALQASVGELSVTAASETSHDLRRAACQAALAATDLELIYRGQAATDLGRIALWGRLAAIDAEAGDLTLLRNDIAVIEAMWERTKDRLEKPARTELQDRLVSLTDAVAREDLMAVGVASGHLVRAFEGLIDVVAAERADGSNGPAEAGPS